MPNYIYVRGKNFADTQTLASAVIYWAYEKQLSDPNTWQQLETSGGATVSPLVADADGIAVTQTPFVWGPEAPSTGNPYVLIAVVYDNDYPNPVPDYQTSHSDLSFNMWQASLGGVASLQLAVPAPPKKKTTYSFTGSFDLK
ncbi:MAG: hypothetical protein AAFW82_10550, partial [Pseudomonadota bacterium]